MRKNEWQARFGAARRATDKRLCAELERSIRTQEKERDSGPLMRGEMIADAIDEGRERIARAFGRPL